MLTIAKGYWVTDLNRSQALKDGYLEQLAGVADVATLRREIIAALDAKGTCIKVTKKGNLVACFVLTRDEVQARELSAAQADLGDVLRGRKDDAELVAMESNAPVTVLRMTRRCVLPEHETKVAALEASEEVRQEAALIMLDGSVKAILWGEDTIIPLKVNVGGHSVPGYALGIALGLLFGLMMHNIGIGLCFGVCFAACFGAIAQRK